MPKVETIASLLRANWKSGLTVALISIPLSTALSVASGAGPLPGIITGIWATLIAGCLGGSNYNIIGAAGALTTVLFAATLAAPFGLGASVLPILALLTGAIILGVWAIGADRFLYYIPSSVMYGFAGGVAFLIAASQLFDATGLSALKRTGTFLGDIALFAENASAIHFPTVAVFGLFIAGILLWKRLVPYIPAVIPAAIVGIIVGASESAFFPIGLTTLGEKFGSVVATFMLPVVWDAIPLLFANSEALRWLLGASGTIALIAVLETLITAQIADRITKTQHGSRRELLGLGLANLGSGAMGGLPATGVFIRTGANVKAGATHKTSAIIASVCTAVISLLALPFFSYIPMAVIAAILCNTAQGLIEVQTVVEVFKRGKQSFAIAIIVLLVTVLEDAGIAVAVGAVLALLLFADRVSRGYFDVVFNYVDGTHTEERQAKVLSVPADVELTFITYSIAGFLGYIDSTRHAANFRHLTRAKNVPTVVIRLRNLFTMDFEGEEMLATAIADLQSAGKEVYLTSVNESLRTRLIKFPAIARLHVEGRILGKAQDAVTLITGSQRV